jgi:hypothetical protein
VRLREKDQWTISKGPGIAVEPRPLIRGNEIVLEPHLVSATETTGMRYLHGIDMVVLAELAPSERSIPDLFEACVRRVGALGLHDFLLALATAVARGWLVAE